MPQLYVNLPPKVRDELHHEAERQERTLSWLMQRAWKIARAELRTLAPGREPAQDQPAVDGGAP